MESLEPLEWGLGKGLILGMKSEIRKRKKQGDFSMGNSDLITGSQKRRGKNFSSEKS